MRQSYCDLIILAVEHKKFEENKTNDEGYTKHDCAMCPRHNSHHNISRSRYNKHNNNNNIILLLLHLLTQDYDDEDDYSTTLVGTHPFENRWDLCKWKRIRKTVNSSKSHLA